MSRSVQLFWRIFFGAVGFVVLFLLMINWGWIGDMPDIEDIENPTALQASQVYAQDGYLMGKYYRYFVNLPTASRGSARMRKPALETQKGFRR